LDKPINHPVRDVTSDLFDLQKESSMKIDLTKPFVACSDGRMLQAELKTIAAAKKLAKETAEGEPSAFTAVVFTPHTKYERQLPPVRASKVKVS
jgi:hypothetical protein